MLLKVGVRLKVYRHLRPPSLVACSSTARRMYCMHISVATKGLRLPVLSTVTRMNDAQQQLLIFGDSSPKVDLVVVWEANPKRKNARDRVASHVRVTPQTRLHRHQQLATWKPAGAEGTTTANNRPQNDRH